MKMRVLKVIILKKIHNSFLILSILIAILSTLIAVIPRHEVCQLSNPPRCVLVGGDPLEPYIFMLFMSAIFLAISIIIYIIRRIIIKGPSLFITEKKNSST
jgi:hypothetical protein